MTGPVSPGRGGWSVPATARLDRWLSKQNPAYRLTCTKPTIRKTHAVPASGGAWWVFFEKGKIIP